MNNDPASPIEPSRRRIVGSGALAVVSLGSPAADHAQAGATKPPAATGDNAKRVQTTSNTVAS